MSLGTLKSWECQALKPFYFNYMKLHAWVRICLSCKSVCVKALTEGICVRYKGAQQSLWPGESTWSIILSHNLFNRAPESAKMTAAWSWQHYRRTVIMWLCNHITYKWSVMGSIFQKWCSIFQKIKEEKKERKWSHDQRAFNTCTWM